MRYTFIVRDGDRVVYCRRFDTLTSCDWRADLYASTEAGWTIEITSAETADEARRRLGR